MGTRWPLLGAVAASFIAVGGALPYIPQYWSLLRTRDSRGFSLLVSFVLLVSSILRIFFWFVRACLRARRRRRP